MKYFPLLSILLLLSSCTKDEENKVSKNIIGTWYWESSTDYLNSNSYNAYKSPENTDTVKLLTFSKDKSFEQTNNGKLVKSGNYFLKSGDELVQVVDGKEKIYLINTSETQLELIDNLNSYISHKYSRISLQ